MYNKSSNELQILEAQIYKFKDQKCEKVTGNQWFLIEHQGNLYIKQKKSQRYQIGRELIRIIYQGQQAYYFKYKDIYMAFVFNSRSQTKDLIQYKLQQNGLSIVQWSSARISLKENVKLICGDVQKTPSIRKKSTVQSLSYSIGGFFGAMNNLISKPVQSINNATTKKVQQIKQQHVSQQNKSNWQLFKTKAKQLNKNASQAMKPATQKVSQLTTKIGQKFEQSDNKVIKGIRDFGNNFKNSLNQGYKNFRKTEGQGQKQIINNNHPQSQRQMQ